MLPPPEEHNVLVPFAVVLLVVSLLAVALFLGKVIFANLIEGGYEPRDNSFTTDTSEIDTTLIDGKVYRDQRVVIDSIQGPDKAILRWSKLRVEIEYNTGDESETKSLRVEKDAPNMTSVGDSVVLVLYIDEQGGANTIDEGDVLRILYPSDAETIMLTYYHDGEEVCYVCYSIEDAQP